MKTKAKKGKQIVPSSSTDAEPPAYRRLEHRLVLLAWLNYLLGYESNCELLKDFKNAEEGFDASGRSYIYYRLISRGSKVQIPDSDLARYDENIRMHLSAINARRSQPITLRYFQYLAALYTEIILDRLFNRKRQLLVDLNAFVNQRNMKKLPGQPPDTPFTESDLTKLAYWMATGSGKTLMMHLNYYQFLHYHKEPLDNILLITPNEDLSEQHLLELQASGIPAQRFDLSCSSLWSGNKNTVQVIEVTKLVEEKRGAGVSVPVEAFEGHNLIFVDEGHKGSGGQAWRRYRDALGATGFTFEYSATFGQALSATGNDALTAEYGKAIVFDYSYRYFYRDGYGKDFHILNVKDNADEEKTSLLLLGNLLSFYEQLRLFYDQAAVLRPYNFDKPLWVFVGSTVNAVYTDNGQKRSDVLTVARFLHHVLSNREWTVAGIHNLLNGKSGLASPDGKDLFAGRFPYLRESGLAASAIYEEILRQVFHAPGGGGLHLYEIRSASGELGLKAAGAEDYFGLVYIGDTAEFKKLVEADSAGIVVREDATSQSLFTGINRPDTPINVLIGARKFMEGWNSWRVSNMGLLNIGQQEGSQIIQLFGRGVRLRGKDHCLKRSTAIPGDHPPHIKLLETLNIFAVRANYMAQFRHYLEREGVETELEMELQLPVQPNEYALRRGLVMPRPDTDRDFAAETLLTLAPDEKIRPQVDLSVKVETLESSANGLASSQVRGVSSGCLPERTLALVDWEQVYLDLLDYKAARGWYNLVLHPDTPRTILKGGAYTLRADEAIFHPRTFEDARRLQEAVTAILRRYMELFYRHARKRWEMATLLYRPLDWDDPNLTFNRLSTAEKKATYLVRVPASRKELIVAISKLCEDIEKLIKEENHNLPRIYFDRHLYLPLLIQRGAGLTTEPPALEDSAAQFVRDLRACWDVEKEKSLVGKEIFLLRNLSRGRGLGFFQESGFYPDFILWIVDRQMQRIVFIEPHGMLRAKAYIHDDKARLWESLPELAKAIGQRSGRKDITLDSYIVSATPYDDLYKHYDDGTWTCEKFAQHHILFPVRNQKYDYIKILLSDNPRYLKT